MEQQVKAAFKPGDQVVAVDAPFGSPDRTFATGMAGTVVRVTGDLVRVRFAGRPREREAVVVSRRLAALSEPQS